MLRSVSASIVFCTSKPKLSCSARASPPTATMGEVTRTAQMAICKTSNASGAVSYFLRLLRECGSDGGCEPVPGVGLFPQTFAACGGEFVKLGTAIVVRRAPVGFEQSLTDQAKQTGIQRTLFDHEGIG